MHENQSILYTSLLKNNCVLNHVESQINKVFFPLSGGLQDTKKESS